MNTVPQSAPAQPSKARLIIGWLLCLVPAALVLLGAVMNLARMPQAVEGAKQMGFPDSAVLTIGVLALVSSLLFLVPRTAVFGAIMMTAYFGGAVATHVHINDGNWPTAVVCGVLTWVGLALREDRLRALLPLRSAR